MTHINQILKTAVTAISCACEYACPNGSGIYLERAIEENSAKGFRSLLTINDSKNHCIHNEHGFFIELENFYTFECVFETTRSIVKHIKMQKTREGISIECDGETIQRNMNDFSNEERTFFKQNADRWVTALVCMTDAFKKSNSARISMRI